MSYPYTISEEYLAKLIVEKGYEHAENIDNASFELILDEDEQASWFFDCLRRVYDNPRYYLDNLDFLTTFKVNITEIFPDKKR